MQSGGDVWARTKKVDIAHFDHSNSFETGDLSALINALHEGCSVRTPLHAGLSISTGCSQCEVRSWNSPAVWWPEDDLYTWQAERNIGFILDALSDSLASRGLKLDNLRAISKRHEGDVIVRERLAFFDETDWGELSNKLAAEKWDDCPIQDEFERVSYFEFDVVKKV